MLTINYPFTTAGNYTAKSLLEFLAGKCQYKLKDLTGQTFDQDFSNDTGFTYDSAKAEFSGGQVQQKTQRPTNATFGATYTSNINGSWGDGSLAGTGTGSPVITGNKLDLTGGTIKYIDYNASGNANSQQAGTIRLKVTPNYTGNPANNQYLFSISKDGASNNNLIYLYQNSGNGYLSYAIYDQNGSLVISGAFGKWNTVALTTYEICLCFDFTTGATRLFLDGVQLGSTVTVTCIRNSDIGLLRVGNARNPIYATNYYIEDFVYYNDVLFTSNYTPGYTLQEYDYLTSIIDLPQFSYTGLGAVQAFTNFVTSESNGPRYILNGQYWDGGAWSASSDTWATASPAADVLANLGSLAAADTLDITIIFNNSNIQMAVSNLTVTYTGQEYPQESDAQDVVPNSGFRSDKIESFTATSSTNAKFIFSKDGAKFWYTGGAWTASDGSYAQANTAAELTPSVLLQLTSIGADFLIYTVFGGTGSTQEYIDDITIGYDFAGDQPTIVQSTIWGYLYDLAGNPLASKRITGELLDISEFASDGAVLDVSKQETLTDVNGYWEIKVAYSSTDSEPPRVKFFINGEQSIKTMQFQSSIKFAEMADA